MAPTIFESFNARVLEPEQVAKTFVPPDHFKDVLKRAHTLIVGPRGSGKTTVLKMLQVPALEVWNNPEAEDYRARIDFTGVFIPADRSWSEQINAVGEGHLTAEERRLFGTAAFTTHVLHSLVEAMLYRVHPTKNTSAFPFRRVQLCRADEAELVRAISKEWYLELAIPSLLSLKHALTSRFSKIFEISLKEILLGSEGRNERLSNIPFLLLNFLRATGAAVELFDDIAGQGRSKWGLLFDELELAPQWIHEELLSAMRSANSQLLFKLSMSPFSENAELLHNLMSATYGNDYNQVALWYAHKEDGYSFCNKLFEAMLKERGLPYIHPSKVFGRSEFETKREEDISTGTAYRNRSVLQQKFKLMSDTDSSFRNYIDRKHLDLENIDLLSEDERAAGIRKVRSLIAVREAFRSPDGTILQTKQLRRSRKNPKLYSGALSLFAMVEGNPRWFIGIIGDLVDEYAKSKRKIRPDKQSLEIAKAVNRFRAYLRTIPSPILKKNQPPRGVLSILDIIGNYFHHVVVVEDFSPDPVLTFNVDSRSDDQLLESLGRALNAGAIVYVNELDGGLILKSLRGKRFRLSYILASHYGIPLILGRDKALSAILDAEQKSSHKKRQNSLFKGER
jgi:hypothetical protein